MEILVNRLSIDFNATAHPLLEASSRATVLNASLETGYLAVSRDALRGNGSSGFHTNGSVTESVYDTTTVSGNSSDGQETSTMQSVQVIVVLSILYGIVFVLALVGNISVVIMVAKDRSLHTATNFFLVNMAVADILIAIFCLPITLLYNIFSGKYPGF